MNGKVEQLGLLDTHFTNAHGLDDPEMYTSAFDMAMLGQEYMRQPELAAIVSTRVYQPAWDAPPLWNGNRLLSLYPEAIGVKIGFTDDAGGTIVAAAERDGRVLIASVLGSAGIYQDAITLLDWAFSNAPPACQE
jgi:D-alanyl-D-alanine carboxypeptidase